MIDNYNIQLLYVELFNKVHFFWFYLKIVPKVSKHMTVQGLYQLYSCIYDCFVLLSLVSSSDPSSVEDSFSIGK